MARAICGWTRPSRPQLVLAITVCGTTTLHEKALPAVAELAKRVKLEIVLFRAYTLPTSALAADPEAHYLVSDEK